jgi:hypothetical protein
VDINSGSQQNQIASIVISRDMSPFQSLFVIYYKDGSRSTNPEMKVFRSDPETGRF